MIIGLGTDIVEIERIEKSIQRSGDSFVNFVYTPQELEHAPNGASVRHRMEYLAGRWAAKEAVSKALGTGITSQCALQDIGILPDKNGRPQVFLSGAAAVTSKNLGIVHWHISISHDTSHAIAVAICEGNPS